MYVIKYYNKIEDDDIFIDFDWTFLLLVTYIIKTYMYSYALYLCKICAASSFVSFVASCHSAITLSVKSILIAVAERIYLTKMLFCNAIICFDFYETSIMSLRRRCGEGFANFIIFYIVMMGMVRSASNKTKNLNFTKGTSQHRSISFYFTWR